MSKYRLKSNFDGTWDIETEVEKTSWHRCPDTQQNTYDLIKVWESTYGERKLSYSAAKRVVESKISEEAFKPTFLTPPLPARDPTLPPRKRFLGIF